MNQETIEKSIKRSVNGGTAGFLAMTGQVFSMMWLRTTMNYQFRHGGSFTKVTKTLFQEGGIPRFYRGISFAIMQAPVSRFGDTMMNELATNLLKDTELSTATKTFCGSLGAGLWRMSILPIDTCKSSLQVNGNKGWNQLKMKWQHQGIKSFYQGAFASGTATAVGHFPWFFTYNKLNEIFPKKDFKPGLETLSRSAAIGFIASGSSDLISNSFRVVKVNRQTRNTNQSYYEIVKDVIKTDGVSGLMTRGLRTKILTNAVQGMVFTVLFDFLK